MKPQLDQRQRAAQWIMALAASSLILGACAATPTPPEPPSISIEPPGPSIDVAPGETRSLRAGVNPPEPEIEAQITWTSTCYQDDTCNVLNDTTGTDIFFTAPGKPGEQVIVRATVKDKYGRETSTALAFKVQIPTPTPEPPTPTPTPIPEPPVIAAPKEEDEVEMNITVAGSGAKASMPAGTNLYVLVKPFRLDYWVQPYLTVNSDGTWSVSVGVGQKDDQGRAFKICAVLTSQAITNTHFSALPPGPSSCITVTRKQKQ